MHNNRGKDWRGNTRVTWGDTNTDKSPSPSHGRHESRPDRQTHFNSRPPSHGHNKGVPYHGSQNRNNNNSEQNTTSMPGMGRLATLNTNADKELTALKQGNIRVLPLGGQGEKGRCSWLYEQNDQIIIVDAGVGYAPHGVRGGVDLLLPNLESVVAVKDKIKALFISNVHEEHVGDMLRMINELSIKNVFLPSLVYEFYKDQIPSDVSVTILDTQAQYQVGVFSVSAFRVGFVCPDAFVFLIQTSSMRILHALAVKADHNPPIAGHGIDVLGIASDISDLGVDLLISGSSNVEMSSYPTPEASVYKKMYDLVTSAKQKLVFLIAEGQIHRLKVLLSVLQQAGKSLVLCDDYLRKCVDICQKLSYLTADETKVISNNSNIYVISAPEGEIMEIVGDLAEDTHPGVRVSDGDLIVLASGHPMGTNRLLAKFMDQLFLKGARVIFGREGGVHVPFSGSREDLKLLHNLVRPKYFLPANGEVRQLIQHAELIGSCGTDPKNIIIIDNGNAVDFDMTAGTSTVAGRINVLPIFFNKAAKSAVNRSSIEDRQRLGEEGAISISLAVDLQREKIIAGPLVTTVGYAFESSQLWAEMLQKTSAELCANVQKALKNGQKELGLLRRLTGDTFNKAIREKFGDTGYVFTVLIQEIKS